MTFENMRERVWDGLGTDADTGTDLVPDSELIDRLINDWQYDLINRIWALKNQFGQRDMVKIERLLRTLSTTASRTGDGTTKSFSLPTNYMYPWYVLVGTIYSIEGDAGFLRAVGINTFYTADTTTPIHYYGNSNINFVVAPAAGTVTMGYFKHPAAVSSDGTSELPAELHHTCPLYALSEIYKIDGDDLNTSKFNREYMNELERFL